MKRTLLVLMVGGFALLVLGATLLTLAQFRLGVTAKRLQSMGQLYLGLGVASLAFRLILGAFTGRARRYRQARRVHDQRRKHRYSVGDDAYPPVHRKKRRRRRHGSVLVLVLVVVALVSGLVIQAQFAARAFLAAEREQARSTRLELAAADQVLAALQTLADDEDLGVDHLEEPWALAAEHLGPTGIEYRLAVVDENRFLNLNNLAAAPRAGTRAASSVLLGLFSRLGAPDPTALSEALRDWVDDDQEGPFEAPFYRSEELGYEPPNRPLLSRGELLSVAGFDAAAFIPRARQLGEDPLRGLLADAVTVAPVPESGFMRVNLNTAGRDVLRAMFGAESDVWVEQLLRERALRPLRRLEGSGLLPAEAWRSLQPFLDVKSTLFRITATAEQGGHSRTVRALVRRDNDGAVRVVQWFM